MELTDDMPAWLEALVHRLNFFGTCSAHDKARKKEKNLCCLDCRAAICPRCTRSHRRHRLVQIRRYVYHDVVRLQDLDKLIDCSRMQPYTINSSKVVFLKKRPQSRQFKAAAAGNACSSCDRTLQQPYIHCSLQCKVDYISRNYSKDYARYLKMPQVLEVDDEEKYETNETKTTTTTTATTTTQSTILEDDDDQMWSSEKCNPPCVKSFNMIRKRSSDQLNLVCARASNEDHSTNRRKGIPHRSPLY